MKTSAHSISRLPQNQQNHISQMLLDGATAKQVSDYLVEQGYPSATSQNVSNYRLGAHKKWLQKQERLEAIREDAEKTSQLIAYYSAQGGSPAEAGLLTASELMVSALGKISPSDLLAMMADKPDKIIAVINSLIGVSKYIAERKAPEPCSSEESAKLPPQTRGLSADAMREIERAAKLI